MSKKTISLTGDALAAARLVHIIHQNTQTRRAELEREMNERLAQLGNEAQEQMHSAWAGLLRSVDLGLDELGEWELDASYLDAHGHAFLVERDRSPEDAPNATPLGNILQSLGVPTH